jgi:SAM-dependent methyltransferase
MKHRPDRAILRVTSLDNAGMNRSFEDLVAEADAAPVEGWDFSWLEGRATEERPSWGYQRLMSKRLASATAGLDIQTGGGEVLAEASAFPATMAATESWPPNVAKATRLLHPRGVIVVADPDEPPLPFADEAFDLLTSRHPATVWWKEIARVLRAGGTYFAQHVGPQTSWELVEYFRGPQPGEARHRRHPDLETAEARAAGLEILDVRTERLRMEFFDAGAVVYFLRKVIWTVPGFTVDKYHDRLLQLHQHIQEQGAFIAHSTRTLIEARKP